MRGLMSKQRLLGKVLAALCLAALAGAAVREDALTTADLVRFLRAGISEKVILAELHERGFGEPLDDARESTLREAGATETLVVAVRRAAPAGTAPPAPGRSSPRPRGTASRLAVQRREAARADLRRQRPHRARAGLRPRQARRRRCSASTARTSR